VVRLRHKVSSQVLPAYLLAQRLAHVIVRVM